MAPSSASALIGCGRRRRRGEGKEEEGGSVEEELGRTRRKIIIELPGCFSCRVSYWLYPPMF